MKSESKESPNDPANRKPTVNKEFDRLALLDKILGNNQDSATGSGSVSRLGMVLLRRCVLCVTQHLILLALLLLFGCLAVKQFDVNAR